MYVQIRKFVDVLIPLPNQRISDFKNVSYHHKKNLGFLDQDFQHGK